MMAEEVEQTPHISKLPEIILRRILLTPRTENLLRYTSACARVCPEWRAIVMGSAAYALALPSRKLFLEDVRTQAHSDSQVSDLTPDVSLSGTRRAR